MAKDYFRAYPNKIKLSRKFSACPHSFIKINQKIYAMEYKSYLGCGAFNKVKILQDETGENYKVNIFSQQSGSDTTNHILHFLGEFYGEATRHLSEDKILNLKNKSLLTRAKTYRVLTLYPGQTLRYYLESRRSLEERFILAIKLTKLLQRLHGFRIIHRDIKPENIIIDDQNDLHLIDYDFAAFLPEYQNSLYDNFMGTKDYMAPEIKNGLLCSYSFSSDYYALGCIFQNDLQIPWEFCKPLLSTFPGYRDLKAAQKALLNRTNQSFLKDPKDTFRLMPIYSLKHRNITQNNTDEKSNRSIKKTFSDAEDSLLSSLPVHTLCKYLTLTAHASFQPKSIFEFQSPPSYIHKTQKPY